MNDSTHALPKPTSFRWNIEVEHVDFMPNEALETEPGCDCNCSIRRDPQEQPRRDPVQLDT